MPKHTPGPWKVSTFGKHFVVRNGKDNLVCNSYGSTVFEEQANARFIVTACNSHYELLEACKEAKNYIESHNELEQYYTPKIIRELEQAIAKAEENNG